MNSNQSIAIVLSTYNGEKYISEQLDSIRLQSRTPNKVVIRDDCSTDMTATIIERYIEQFGLESQGWQFAKGDINIGWKRSFKQLIMYVDADIVFLCDQDDIWELDKIETMAKLMEEYPSYNVLASLVEPFYEKGSIHSFSDSRVIKGSSELSTAQMQPSQMIVSRPGCSYCYRSSFAHALLPYWDDSYPHDAMLWRYALFANSLGLVNLPLVHFRRHESNASRRTKATKSSRLSEMEYYIDFSQNMIRYFSQQEKDNSQVIVLLNDYLLWLEARKCFIQRPSSVRSFLSTVAHLDYYPSCRSLLADVACSIGLSV